MLQTKRLLLQDYTMKDIANYCKLRKEKDVWRYSSIQPTYNMQTIERELEERIALMRSRKYRYSSLFLKETGQYIGEAGVIQYNTNEDNAVIGYNLLPEFWNKGYTTEIVNALISFLFDEYKFEKIEALTLENNLYSCKLLESLGFLKSRIIDNYTMINDQLYPVCCYSLKKKDRRIEPPIDKR